MTKEIRFTDIDGIRTGHADNLKAATGATVLISEAGATVGVDVRGGAPGTRETDLSIGAIATNAALTKAQATKLASMAHDGYARAMRPAHSMVAGDTIFAMATGPVAADFSVVGLLAARVMERGVAAAVRNAEPLCGLPCRADLNSA